MRHFFHLFLLLPFIATSQIYLHDMPPPPQINEYTTPGVYTWTKPAGAKRVEVYVIGGGGGGSSGTATLSGTTSSQGGRGGLGGQIGNAEFSADSLASTITIKVGAGGAGGIAPDPTLNAVNGACGDTSYFGDLIVCLGGRGGGQLSNISSCVTATAPFRRTVAGANGMVLISNYNIAIQTMSGSGASSSFGGACTHSILYGCGSGAGGGSGNSSGGLCRVIYPHTATNVFTVLVPAAPAPGNNANGNNGGNGVPVHSLESFKSGQMSTQTAFSFLYGTGGGGGSGANITTNGVFKAGDGGNGHVGAGGGGGGGLNHTNTAQTTCRGGNGGNGGNGAVVVVTYFN